MTYTSADDLAGSLRNPDNRGRPGSLSRAAIPRIARGEKMRPRRATERWSEAAPQKAMDIAAGPSAGERRNIL
jgi:hypothetical protein